MVVRPTIGEVGGSSTRVPAPALTIEMRELVVPLPPLIAELTVSTALPTVQMLRCEKPAVWSSTPPEIVVVPPLRTRMPPDSRLTLTPSPSTRLDAPSNVSEFGLTDAGTARLPTAESRTLLLTVTLALYSLGLRGRTRRLLSGRPALVALTVAKEVPKPVSVLSAKAHGKMPLFCVPEPPP